MSIGGDSVEDTTHLTVTQEVALPTTDGRTALFAYVSFESDAITDGVVVRPGVTGGTVSHATALWIGAGTGVVLNVGGNTHMLHMGTGTVGQLHVTPLANQ
jgi:hypothetical protein